MKKKSSVLFLILCILIMTGCATNELASKNDVVGLEKKYYETAESLSAIRKNQAELGAKIDALQSDLQVLTGRFEEGRYQTEKSLKGAASARENYNAQIKELDSRLNSLKERLNAIELSIANPQPAITPETKNRPEIKPRPETKPHTEAKQPEKTRGDLYREAYSVFKNGDTATARDMFKKFLKAYPKGEYSDKAQYLLAETYYMDKDYENAILSFEDVIKKFPKSDKVPIAMLKQGYSFYELGDKPSGKLLMERVIEKFPKSEEASLAKKKLKGEPYKPAKKKK